LNFWNACYQSVQNFLYSRLLSKNLKFKIYKTIILSVVLYGCETWTLPLTEEHRLRLFENRELRRIFVRKREEMVGGWRRLHNEELQNLYASPNIIRGIEQRRMRWGGACSTHGRDEKCIQSEGNRPLGRPRRRWEDNNRTDLSDKRVGTFVLDSCASG
jgi:hypothetical protein